MSPIFSQDFHLSQYWATPLNINPANTGAFNKNIRLSSSYRNQWIQNNSFNSFYASVDANVLRKKLNGDYLGIGLSFSQELEGKNSFRNTNFIFSFAYNKKIDKQKLIHNFSLGFNTIYTSKQINFTNLVYGNLFENGNNFDPIDFYNYKNNSFFDLGLGLNYSLLLNKKHLFNIGFSSTNILEQAFDYYIYSQVLVYRKHTVNFSSELHINNSFTIIPLSYFQTQGPHSEFIFGTYFKYLLTNRNKTALYLGLQYRLVSHYSKPLARDAVILGSRAKYKSFDLGISYDFTISSLRNSTTLIGSPEISLSYEISLKNSNTMTICPSF